MPKIARLPSDLEAEQTLLGALIKQPEQIPEHRAILSGNGLFQDRRNERLLAAVCAIADRGERFEPDPLRQLVREMKADRELGDHISNVILSASAVTPVKFYAGIVVETHRLRRLFVAGEALMRKAQDGAAQSSELIDAFQKDIDAVRSQRPVKLYTGRSLAECRAIAGSLTWIWPRWIQSEGLTIIAGPPGSGKTTLTLWLMVRCAIMGGQWPDKTPSQPRPGKKILLLLAEPVTTQIGNLVSDYQLPEDSLLFLEGPRRDVIEPVRLNQPTWLEIEALFARQDVFAIVLDSLHAALAGLDRNKPECVEPTLQRLQILCARFHKPAILIAHTKKIGDAKLKKGAYTDLGIDPLELVLGTTEISYAVDSVIGVLKLGDGEFRMAPWKVRSADPPPTLAGSILPAEHEIAFEPSPEARSEQTKQTKAADWILNTLASYGGRIGKSSIRELADKESISPRTLSRAASTLQKDNKIHRDSSNWFLGPPSA